MTTTKPLRDVLDVALAEWHLIPARGYSTWRTYRHCSRRWTVALCLSGAAAGTLRVTEMDMQGHVVYRPRVERVWEWPEPEQVALLLLGSGAPNTARPSVEAAA